MKFTNLRLVGFKSFVETTDFEIREGLTGVVGPNGCGKSNLLEALRWVMGATSAKALRGDAMADVIFSGTSARPGRNWAEVTLTLDNADRTAPAEFNDNAVLEVSRRILNREDGAQSIYRINGRDVRAKDIQLLFADAATGANSPALVRQGQVGELINAKPQNRRRLLEDAAGVSGLHARRHEAELRLRAAEQNLSRLNDVLGELETQKAALARQARQATRYRNLSGDIRRAEAFAAYLRWRDARDAREDAVRALEDSRRFVADSAGRAANAAAARLEAHSALDPLREAEARAAAALHRLTVERETLEADAARAVAELRRLDLELERLAADAVREESLLRDADDALDALGREEDGLGARAASEADRLRAAAAHAAEAADALAGAERAHDGAAQDAAEIDARRRALKSSIDDATRRGQKIRAEIDQLEQERARLALSAEQTRAHEEAAARFAAAEDAARAAESALHRADEELREAQTGEAALRAPRQRAEQSARELKAERDALRRVLASAAAGDWPALIESVAVAPGLENALAAALGDDLGAALQDAAPAFWSSLGAQTHDEARALPGGAEPLTAFVEAPAALTRRLGAVGLVDPADGARLQVLLAPGQRLVSRAGDLWRWDGFIARAEAKSAAAIRLEQRNRCAALDRDIASIDARASEAARAHEEASALVLRRQAAERDARMLIAEARRTVDGARARLDSLERARMQNSSRAAAIEEAMGRLGADLQETDHRLHALAVDQADLPDAAMTHAALADLREALARARARAGEMRAALLDLEREARMRAERLAELSRERGAWATRRDTARTRAGEVAARRENALAARAAAADEPARLEGKRAALLDLLSTAETARREAGDALALAIAAAEASERRARDADSESTDARERAARAEAHDEAASARLDETRRYALETCNAEPEELLRLAEHKDGADLPAREDVERRLERYKREREALGGVNLRADEEMQEIAQRLVELAAEREDCDSAVRKLRAAIGALNREARQRLNAAFETVNRNFSTLFTRLFNGGQAELRLIDSEDPIEAGLEIFASPPGKKLASMSLMSGGEQALTATALIFAVFMANPAPVCVLDEVDAPLDDANTERFCRLLQEMITETKTRFIVITHQPLTMSRMDRLFGVTMIERGVSQLVSVDLKRAEQLVAAE